MSSRLALKVFFAYKPLSWESIAISMECTSLCKEGRNPLVALCGAQWVSQEDCHLTEWEIFPVSNLAISHGEGGTCFASACWEGKELEWPICFLNPSTSSSSLQSIDLLNSSHFKTKGCMLPAFCYKTWSKRKSQYKNAYLQWNQFILVALSFFWFLGTGTGELQQELSCPHGMQ